MESAARLRICVLLVLIVVVLMSSLGAAWHTGDWGGLALNFGTEMTGAVVTYLLLELVIGRKEWREARKADLIAQLGSSVEDVAVAAAKELWRHGWLHDGSLRGAYLGRANLEGADLSRASLYEADLSGANLYKVNLYKANLSGANLSGANLEGADLNRASLSGARLLGASLEYVALPDGTNWTPDIDMARFIDPEHPDFRRYDERPLNRMEETMIDKALIAPLTEGAVGLVSNTGEQSEG